MLRLLSFVGFSLLFLGSVGALYLRRVDKDAGLRMGDPLVLRVLDARAADRVVAVSVSNRLPYAAVLQGPVLSFSHAPGDGDLPVSALLAFGCIVRDLKAKGSSTISVELAGGAG